MKNEQDLLSIAENQQGYFTSSQAEVCGFSRSNFNKKIKSGKWIKEKIRGVYRLSHFPVSKDSELILWQLWSRDKKGKPQGVWSHETALGIHGLSDIAPSKLHMTVPKGFRKEAKIPKVLYLHFEDEIPEIYIKQKNGFRVTTPLRTIRDVIREESIQPEQLELSILDHALKQSLTSGLATIKEIETLKEIETSQEIKQIITRAIETVWKDANTKLEEFGYLIEPYTIGLGFGTGTGTGVLCQFEGRYFILTAGHVARAFSRSSSVSLMPRLDQFIRRYPSTPPKNFTVFEWDSHFDQKKLEDPIKNEVRDLGIIIPNSETLNMLGHYKLFYKLTSIPASISLKNALVSMGGIEPSFDQKNEIKRLNKGPYGFVASGYLQFSETDYIACPVSNQTFEMRSCKRKPVASFCGLSGSGLWKFENEKPILVGIAIAQNLKGYDHSGFGDVYFHGPQSILSFLSKIGITSE